MNAFRATLLFLTLICVASNSAAQLEPQATEAESPATDATPASRLPDQALTPQITYQLLLAEIGLTRGNLQLALAAYLDLAQTTRDPRIAKRAAEIALYSRQADAAMQAVRLWVEVDPVSSPARQMYANLLIAANRTDLLAPELAQILALEKDNPGDALERISRLLARLPDRQAAQKLIEQATAPYDALPEAHLTRAHAAQAAGNESQAVAEIDRALQLRPDWEQAALFKAHLLQRNRGQAADVLRRFLDAHPQARDARLAYARILVGDNRYDEARRQFRTLLDANHADPDVIYAVAILSLQLNDRTEAEAYFKRLLEMGYADSNNIRLQLGQLAENDKRWDEAIRWYDQVTSGEQYVLAQSRAASVQALQGRIDEGRKRLQEGATAYPSDRAQFQVAEAIMLRDAGRAADAFTVLEKSLAENPDQTELLYEAALLAERLGKADVLERNLRRVIALKPDNAQAYNALGYSLADRNIRLDEAQQLIDKALSLAPQDPFILDSKGWVLFRRGDNPAALEALQRAFAIRSDPEIAAHIGEVQWVLGRHAEAEKTWSEAFKASPDNEALAATIKKFKP